MLELPLWGGVQDAQIQLAEEEEFVDFLQK